MKDLFLNVLGLIVFIILIPVAVIISPLLVIAMYVNYRRAENDAKSKRKP